MDLLLFTPRPMLMQLWKVSWHQNTFLPHFVVIRIVVNMSYWQMFLSGDECTLHVIVIAVSESLWNRQDFIL